MPWHTAPSEQKKDVSLRLLVALLAFTTILNLLIPLFVSSSNPNANLQVEEIRNNHTYHDDDFPRELPIKPLKPVAITVEDSINFQLDTDEGAIQWRSIFPSGGGYVTLGPAHNRRQFRISMFHAMDCLDTIRHSVLARHADKSIPPSEDTHFCLNYLRQMILCRSDVQLEQVRSEYGGKSVQPFVTHNNCRDWSTVYEEIERLQNADVPLDLEKDQ